MKKKVLALTLILTLLVSYTVVFADLATANPVAGFDPAWVYLPKDPLKTPATISIESPAQKAEYNSTNISLNFTVIKPEGYYQNAAFGGPPPPGFASNNNHPPNGVNASFLILGSINSVYYQVDGGKNYSLIVNDFDHYITYTFPQSYLTFSYSLNLTSGAHFVRVGVDFDSYYWIGYPPVRILELQTVSDPINFTVTLLHPTILVPPENIVYNESSVPLAFTLDNSTTSWMGYSLDGKSNVTTTSNTTLTGLTNGEHNITLYANDTFGHIYASQPANFTVALPPEMRSFPTAAVAAVSGVSAVAVVAAGLLVYLKKRKH